MTERWSVNSDRSSRPDMRGDDPNQVGCDCSWTLVQLLRWAHRQGRKQCQKNCLAICGNKETR